MQGVRKFTRRPTRNRKYFADQKTMLLQIYVFKNHQTPDDKNWIRRIVEERGAFWVFKSKDNIDRLPHFTNIVPNLENKRIFHVKFLNFYGEEEWAIIRLPIRYPEQPPDSIITVNSTNLEVYTSHTDTNKCLGKLVTWEPYKMGISHWLFMVEEFLAITQYGVKI